MSTVDVTHSRYDLHVNGRQVRIGKIILSYLLLLFQNFPEKFE
jgi:hypothetical protein